MVIQQQTNELYLTWKHPSTRERYVIGILVQNDQEYGFRYFQKPGTKNVYAAIDTGAFRLLPGMHDTNATYTSKTLFEIFQHRLPKNIDQETQEKIKSNGWPLDEFHILRYTQGRLPTDTFEFLDPIKANGKLRVDCPIAGWRYYEGDQCLDHLKSGDAIRLEVEENNEYDPHAIIVRCIDGRTLGYVPSLYSRHIDEFVKRGQVEAWIVEVDRNNEPVHRCKIHIEAEPLIQS